MDPEKQEQNKSEDAVLTQQLLNRTALKNATSGGNAIEDEDLALAKILQEQERAFLVLSSSGMASTSVVENVPPPPPSSGHSPSSDDNRPLTDEELAWKLMQEEEAEFQQRMLALAGVRPRNRSPHHNNIQRQHTRDGYDDDNDTNRIHTNAVYNNDHTHPDIVYSDDDDNYTDDNDNDDDDDDIPDVDAMSYEELTALGDIVGTVATGLTQEQIRKLPTKKYKKNDNTTNDNATTTNDDDDDNGEQCVVCRVEYEDDEDVIVLPCHHVYHSECISQWFERKKVCPQCNAEVVIE